MSPSELYYVWYTPRDFPTTKTVPCDCLEVAQAIAETLAADTKYMNVAISGPGDFLRYINPSVRVGVYNRLMALFS